MATINNGGRISSQDLANLIAIVQNPNLFGLTQQEFKEIAEVIRREALAISRISMNANLQEDFDFTKLDLPEDHQKLSF